MREIKDEKLRLVSLWVAGFSGAMALTSYAAQSLQPLVLPAAWLVTGLATLLFLRMLFSQFYRSGVDRANLEMQGHDPWPGKPKKFSDPDWGLFGTRTGDRRLLWIRAILVLGMLPNYLAQHWAGGNAGWLWFAAAFVAMELSIMHLAVDAHSRTT